MKLFENNKDGKVIDEVEYMQNITFPQFITDGIFVGGQAVRFIEELGLLEEFRRKIAKHPEDLPALDSLIASSKIDMRLYPNE